MKQRKHIPPDLSGRMCFLYLMRTGRCGHRPLHFGGRNACFFRASSTATATLTAAPPWVSSAQRCESDPATCRWQIATLPMVEREAAASYFFSASSTATATLTVAPPWVSSAQRCESDPATCRWQDATLPMVEREAAASYFFSASSTATATETVAPTMGLLPMPRKPIISTWAGTEEEPANWASECIRPMVSVMP